MEPIRLFNKAMYNLDAKDYAKVVNETAKRSKNFAMNLISKNDIRGNVSPRDVIRACNSEYEGFYDKSGKITEEGKNELLDTIKEMFKLTTREDAKKITVREAINNAVNHWENKPGSNFDITA
ncbi:MAG: hypothetical protein NC191_03285 [Muribaculaceae bacterium]|nr:hypothetical protein [Muribaculaceae bacterium]